MTVSSSMTPHEIGFSLALNPAALVPVGVELMSQNQIERVRDSVRPKSCYENSVYAAVALGADAVILGAVECKQFGIVIEHAWIELRCGIQVDPTFQLVATSFDLDDHAYHQLARFPMETYFEQAELLGDSPSRPIDFMALRRAPSLRHLFTPSPRCAAKMITAKLTATRMAAP